MTLKLSELTKTLESRLPLDLQEPWDVSGLNLGDPQAKIKNVLFAYDVCREVVEAAIRDKCQLIVSHHPFRMKAKVNLNLASYEGRLIQSCLKNGIALYSCHTSHDCSRDSLNFHYLNKLEVKNIQPLNSCSAELVKLAVFVPKEHTNQVSQALFDAGAGHVSAYSECSFRSSGTGTFKGDDTTSPAYGQKNKREEVIEERLEVILKRAQLNTAVQAMTQTHPYEEVAYDVYPLVNRLRAVGLGAYGRWEKPKSKTEVVQTLKKLFKTPTLRWIANPKQKKFQSVGICTGSGSSLIPQAQRKKLDLFITGDVKYHQAIEAKRADLAIADVGHFYSEKDSVLVLKKIFGEVFGTKLGLKSYTKLKDAFEFL